MVRLYAKEGAVYVSRNLEALSFRLYISSKILHLLYQSSQARRCRLQVVMAY